MTLKAAALKFHAFTSGQLGLDLYRLFLAGLRLPRFAWDLLAFRRQYRGDMGWMPCLHDRSAEGGDVQNEYFWQDLTVARWIHEAKPRHHVDIGSRLDGFVAHVASFRSIEVIDIRPLSAEIPGVTFKRLDFSNTQDVLHAVNGRCGYCDSVSCLHVLEHIGLGRYGDSIDVVGYQRALTNLAALLEPAGILYLSTPMGRPRVEFNAHRVFSPSTIIDASNSCGLRLLECHVYVGGSAVVMVPENEVARFFDSLDSEEYRLVILKLTKDQSNDHDAQEHASRERGHA